MSLCVVTPKIVTVTFVTWYHTTQHTKIYAVAVNNFFHITQQFAAHDTKICITHSTKFSVHTHSMFTTHNTTPATDLCCMLTTHNTTPTADLCCIMCRVMYRHFCVAY